MTGLWVRRLGLLIFVVSCVAAFVMVALEVTDPLPALVAIGALAGGFWLADRP